MLEGKKLVAWEIHGDVIVARFTVPRITEMTQAEDAFKEMQTLAQQSIRMGGKVLLNLSNMQFMSSTGLARLVDLRKKTTAMGVHLRLCSLTPLLTNILKGTGMLGILDIHPTQQDALDAFKKIQHEGKKSD
ncbi:MAG: STAS domain-containing protein [Planctomycetes bacterium]|nr:STAS domain-containing protein [Planctomycetota bacterium]